VKRHFRGFGRPTIALGLLFLTSLAGAQQPLLDRVDAVNMTVADIDRAVDFYSKVLTFEKVSDRKWRARLTNTCKGLRAADAVVRMRLGDEYIELTEYSPKGRSIAVDATATIAPSST